MPGEVTDLERPPDDRELWSALYAPNLGAYERPSSPAQVGVGAGGGGVRPKRCGDPPPGWALRHALVGNGAIH
jgi:hypothetical protein